ncbi:unnamed protein product [Arctia plantaginis]|uniref:cardiolipin synthase (CMP-forming) n=1 Tax=Arctia plantaginis TaxID=874455 RepID=A0A8S1AEY0_ARCPL|nr:unnamed protein product [Arctia plantaginis]
MKLLARCNFVKNVSFLSRFHGPHTSISIQEYLTILSNRRQQQIKLSFISCLYSSNEKKQFITLEKKAHSIKDALDHKKVLLKDAEHKIRQKSEEIVRDLKQQNKITSQKFKVQKEYIIKDIIETKGKIKERIEDVIEKENIYTIPNILCITRIAMSPYLGYTIFQEQYYLALGLLACAGITDLLDGWIARNWKGQSTKMGSFLDPMADKVLIATLFVSLTYQNLIPLPLTLLIVSRDVALVIAAFVIRYISLPQPRTLSRYFDVTHATAQLAPTTISKFNTAIQLLLVGTTLASPVFGYVDHPALQTLCAVTAASTIVSALSYLVSKDTYKVLNKKSK